MVILVIESPFEKGSTLEGKNMLPLGATSLPFGLRGILLLNGANYFFPSRVDPFSEGVKRNYDSRLP